MLIRNAADPTCASHLESSIQIVDHILTLPEGPVKKNLRRRLKRLFGVEALEHDEDFVSLIEASLALLFSSAAYLDVCAACVFDSLRLAHGRRRTGILQLGVRGGKSFALHSTSLYASGRSSSLCSIPLMKLLLSTAGRRICTHSSRLQTNQVRQS